MSELRWTAGGTRFIRRGVNTPPTAPTVCWVDEGYGLRKPGPAHPAIWREGAYLKPDGEALGFHPQFWTVIDTGPAPAPIDKPPMPEAMLAAAAKARTVNLKRLGPPEVVAWMDAKGWWCDNPFRAEDENAWLHLLCQSFGTRSTGVICAFLEALMDACGTEWDAEAGCYGVAENRLRAAMDIITSQRPRNAAEAAHCAHLVALHFSGMKLAKNIMARDYPDDRTIATLARVTQTYGNGMELLARMRRPNRAKRQSITVERHNHIHYHDEKHLHAEGGGSDDFGGQAQAKRAQRARARTAADRLPECPALPSPNEGGEILLQPCGEGEASLSNAWRFEGDRGAEGTGERSLEARWLDERSGVDAAGSVGAAKEDQGGAAE